MIDTKEQQVYNLLESLKIKYTRHKHIPVYTVEEAQALDIKIPGQQCKNLFLRNKKGNKHYLVILDENKKADLKYLSKQIESDSLSFASEERLYKYLSLTPGAVTPFGLINDINKEVIVLVDNDIVGKSVINFHPNVNTATISISYDGFDKFIKSMGNKLYYVNI